MSRRKKSVVLTPYLPSLSDPLYREGFYVYAKDKSRIIISITRSEIERVLRGEEVKIEY